MHTYIIVYVSLLLRASPRGRAPARASKVGGYYTCPIDKYADAIKHALIDAL